jgi:hypothetical protein
LGNLISGEEALFFLFGDASRTWSLNLYTPT